MIDTHSHIYGPEFDVDRGCVLERAQTAGVTHILLPNINAETIAPMLRLCADAPGYCFPMMGLHPEDVRQNYKVVLKEMYALLVVPDNPYVAVGEVGLDFYWDTTHAQLQQEAFRQQVSWAESLGLPLVIHCRSAHEPMVAILREFDTKRLCGIFHCFSGTAAEAENLLTFENFYLGIGGVLTYKKSGLPQVLSHVPLERIVLETDAPYLAPVPHRGQRNESAYVSDTLMCLASVKGVCPEDVESITDANVRRLFPKIFSVKE